MMIQELHKSIMTEVSRLIASQVNRRETYGRELVDLPEDDLILYGTKLTYPEGGPLITSGKHKSTSTIELTKTTDVARPTFEWLAEITIKQPDAVEHYLLCPNGSIIETYGKNVFPVHANKAMALLGKLKKI